MTNNLPIADPIRTAAIIHRYHLRAKKSLGQNFLINPKVVFNIIDTAAITPGDQVIEVGPGIGSMTERLLQAGATVLAYELDESLITVLKQEIPQQRQLTILHQDILKSDVLADVRKYLSSDRPIKVVANLPYYITTPILFYFLQSGLNISSLTLMMQKEVAERIVAQPGHKAFGPLSIAVQVERVPKVAFLVPARSFDPAPKVDSAVVSILPLENQPEILNRPLFDKIVKVSFSQRRKTIWNNLKQLIGNEIKSRDELHKILKKVAISEKTRAEQLSINDYLALTQAVIEV